jgi:hypothetical protein
MKKVTVQLFIILIICSVLTAIISIPDVHAWSWDSYEGTTTWDVVVTVDEKECEGGVRSERNTLTITHKKSTAQLTDMGHGPVTGTFFSNILTIPGRTIRDGSGTSVLGGASVTFTPDCLSFYTKYPWRYKDSRLDCSGTTMYQGKRKDAKECPDAFVVESPSPEPLPLPQVMRTAAEIKALPEAEQKAEYEKILDKNPRDFQANYALAHILKDEKDYPGYVQRIDKALENKNYAEKLRKARQDEVKKRLGLTIDPTTVTVPIIFAAKGDLDKIVQPMIYDFNVLKTPDTRSLYQKWTEYLSNKLREPVTN